eukprot:NODE_20684_length_787_cov_2.198485.p2 GENE.NODE_20684_length_787_cov_2.198485~~NODE_20684_length_787_cov_2.198485.p2  ORF type:complete len:161 (-),score=60.79 NODE_20684_length_787_cov_2.198485:304-786(-)
MGLPPPFATRDHFVELVGAGREDVLAQLADAGVAEKVAAAFELSGGDATLLLCRSTNEAAEVAKVMPGATALHSAESTWPVRETPEPGPAIAKAQESAARESWRWLHASTVRELALHEEQVRRSTAHLEGVRFSRAAATRTILASLTGDKPVARSPASEH